MKAYEIQNRRNRITNLLLENKKVKVVDLVEKFQVSDETIRQDLAYLENQGILKKIYGGAELLEQRQLEPVIDRTPIDHPEKQAIVHVASQFIPNHAVTIGLDQGSTVAMLANHLKSYQNKMIFTGSLAAILELVKSGNELYCFGGKYSYADMSFQNDTSDELYPDIKLDLCFLGSSGVLNRHGFCTSSFNDAMIKRKLLDKSTQKIVLLDASKFKTSSLIEVAPWSAVDLVITNKGIPVDIQMSIEAQTKLILV
ncbi:DeoR/GlpR family DNA-binding transcription regulator [Pseudolactococcus yaeyamensis]